MCLKIHSDDVVNKTNKSSFEPQNSQRFIQKITGDQQYMKACTQGSVCGI